jgi:hypothetical protein
VRTGVKTEVIQMKFWNATVQRVVDQEQEESLK